VEIEIAIAIVLLIVMTFLATVDMAFVQLSDLSLRRLAGETEDDTRINTKFLRQILADRPRFRFALSTAIQVFLIAVTVLVTFVVNLFYINRTEGFLVSLLIGLSVTTLCRQIIPRMLTRSNPDRVLLFLLPIVLPLYGLIVTVLNPFKMNRDKTALETSLAPTQADETKETDEDNADNIQTLIEAGEAEGIIEEEDRVLIENIVEFSDTTADEIMTPRTEIEALSINATVREARDIIIESKYSRLPVYREQIDNIEGMIYVRDLLQFWADGKEAERIENLPNLLRPVNFAPETKSIADLFREMQTARVQMAIVIDEYGGVAGLVTVEDILEELVGEIEDEDTEHEEIIEIIESEDKTYYDVLGSVEIGKIERLFGMEIEDDDFTTIAGLVISEIGYVPKTGEHLQFRGLDVEILHADEKKIGLLRLKKVKENKEEESTNSAVI
jgi:CBS domain containing-hemolysin-like protein